MLPYRELEVVDAVMVLGQRKQMCEARTYLEHNRNCCWGGGLLTYIW